jgi:hypothetical protein
MVDLSRVPKIKYAKQEDLDRILAIVLPIRGFSPVTETFVVIDGVQWVSKLTIKFPIPEELSHV